MLLHRRTMFGWTTVKPLPVYKVPFLLQANQSHNLWFPGIQTGTTWKAKVECPSAALTISIPFTESPTRLVA